MASNVINVSSTMSMLVETLRQMYNSLEWGGILIMNYPSSPRKLDLTAKELQSIIERTLNCEVVLAGGIPSAPLWTINKPYLN
jgi:hypothetical protein